MLESECRDPFSGDCDGVSAGGGGVVVSAVGVPRPVFRGLRRWTRRGFGATGPPPVGVPRPVFRGLRRNLDGLLTRHFGQERLAEPRPVLRGLRHHWTPHFTHLPWAGLQSRDPFSRDCDQMPYSRGWLLIHPRLAEPRPVLRGLRRGNSRTAGPSWASPGLQSRDPFSGNCDRPRRIR